LSSSWLGRAQQGFARHHAAKNGPAPTADWFCRKGWEIDPEVSTVVPVVLVVAFQHDREPSEIRIIPDAGRDFTL
jgi:hypothetical protein